MLTEIKYIFVFIALFFFLHFYSKEIKTKKNYKLFNLANIKIKASQPLSMLRSAAWWVGEGRWGDWRRGPVSLVSGQFRKLGLELLEVLREPVAVEVEIRCYTNVSVQTEDVCVCVCFCHARREDLLCFLGHVAVLYGVVGVCRLFSHVPAELRHWVPDVVEGVGALSLCTSQQQQLTENISRGKNNKKRKLHSFFKIFILFYDQPV